MLFPTVDSPLKIMLLNIAKYLVKMTTVRVKMKMQAHTHRGEQLSWKLPLIYSFQPRVCIYKAKILLVTVLFWLALLLLLISVMNSCKTQKVCTIRNAPICHPPAREVAGQDLEEIHSWGLDSEEVSELEA